MTTPGRREMMEEVRRLHERFGIPENAEFIRGRLSARQPTFTARLLAGEPPSVVIRGSRWVTGLLPWVVVGPVLAIACMTGTVPWPVLASAITAATLVLAVMVVIAARRRESVVFDRSRCVHSVRGFTGFEREYPRDRAEVRVHGVTLSRPGWLGPWRGYAAVLHLSDETRVTLAMARRLEPVAGLAIALSDRADLPLRGEPKDTAHYFAAY